MKSKYLILSLAAFFMAACSNEVEDISSVDISTNPVSRSCTVDSCGLGELVSLEETDELRFLKQLYEKSHANNIQSTALSSETDEYFLSNIREISGLPVTIQVRSIASGSTNGYTYLSCSKAGQEVTLSNSESEFYLKILPATSGIPYLIYSNVSRTPLTVGYYTNNPDNKILMSAKDDSGSLFSASWDLLPSSSYKGYFAIESESYLGQSDPNNMWSVFNYVLEAKSGNKIGYGQRVNNKAQQEFLIKPTVSFSLSDLTFDLDKATVTAGSPVSAKLSITNKEYFEQSEKIDIEFSGTETSVFNETAGTLKLNVISSISKKFQRPLPIAGKAVIFEDTPYDALYSKTTQQFHVSKPYSTNITMKPHCLLQLTAKLKTFVLNVPYVVTAKYNPVRGEVREVKVKGIWRGYALADPYNNMPDFESHFYDLESGEEINYSLVLDERLNTYTVK